MNFNNPFEIVNKSLSDNSPFGEQSIFNKPEWKKKLLEYLIKQNIQEFIYSNTSTIDGIPIIIRIQGIIRNKELYIKTQSITSNQETYPDFNSVMKADFLIERPDAVNLFQPDTFKSKDAKANKKKVVDYLNATFDYVIAGIGKLDDNDLKRGADKVKPWYLEGHTHLDLILRAETHTAHHRAQAIGYLRMKGVQPPGYSKYNTL